MEGLEAANEENNQLVNVEIQLDDVEMHTVGVELQAANIEIQAESLEMQAVNLEADGLEMQPANLDMQADYEMQPLNWEMQEANIEMPVPHPNITAERINRRRKKSLVWDHFTIEDMGGGCKRACCNQCKQSYAYSTGSKVAGTSHLKRHITRGSNVGCNRVRNQNGAPTNIGLGRRNAVPNRPNRQAILPLSTGFDPDRCRHEIAKMIIMHDYPLHMVEHPGFIAFVKNLQPQFDMVSFDTVQGDCVATYLREQQSLQKVLEGIPGRICLTLDLWSSSQTVGYVFLTGQFIDSEWKMRKKILRVVMEPFPESDSAFSHSVAACLSDWNMDGRLLSLTINQSLTNDATDNLKALLSVKNPNLLGGQLLLRNCLARSFSSIAQEALRVAQDTVKKVRNSVKYVKTFKFCELKFFELQQQLQVTSTKTLALDDQTQWNTTYEMLLAASELKEVFSCLDMSFPDYKETPSMEDWKLIETLTTYLNLLFDTASLLTTSVIPTTNTFFCKMCDIWLELARASTSKDSFVSNITIPMKALFDKYWNSCYLILAIAVVMDPQYKMRLVEFNFKKIYGDEAATYINYVQEGVHELFNEYVEHSQNFTPTDMNEMNGGSLKSDEGGAILPSNGLGLKDFEMYIVETTSQQSKSELDQYLEESVLPRVPTFDVLGWWKLNKNKYPTLSRMARNLLSVPVCTVGPDLVFHTVSKKMDPYRCSLGPETVEALICAKDWLQPDSSGQQAVTVTMEFPI
ncbi:zinc finger BED domain-containing protein DAYSLEEPER-like [Heracleum sosnowskyi]|uniref:Zinc finger BED domain-containing protein DAYSLEEPER-like n=1 Tax=Heracleum sosnowskyi TaxID=360622 RepID=A0AAD8NA15_9APIA|nr:zinc finger BED domain-containing protein DAYSLEEPER-like [Heracleum sosnowskyi]